MVEETISLYERKEAGVRVVAVTGANGYLGGAICSHLSARGWRVVKLVRSAQQSGVAGVPGVRQTRDERFFDLMQPVSPAMLDDCDLLIHAAYDLSLVKESQVWQVNVEGTRRLLTAASEANVSRVIVISSMSAFEGTEQIYGRAKLAIEGLARSHGACVVRPGLVYAESSGGMAGAVRRLARSPIVPVPGAESRQYPIHEDDFLEAIVTLADRDELPLGPIGIALPDAVSFERLVRGLAKEGQRIRFILIPWVFLYSAMRLVEHFGVRLPIKADSLLGLARPASSVPGMEVLKEMGVAIRPFPD
jgi:nucleoside-diphosphate-sugar epimerase